MIIIYSAYFFIAVGKLSILLFTIFEERKLLIICRMFINTNARVKYPCTGLNLKSKLTLDLFLYLPEDHSIASERLSRWLFFLAMMLIYFVPPSWLTTQKPNSIFKHEGTTNQLLSWLKKN